MTGNSMDKFKWEGHWPQRLEQLLEAELTPENKGKGGGRVWEAARYSLLGGGKRIRAGLVMTAAGLEGDEPPGALESAAAIEMIHCYSLIHDDLPAMDDDDFRRGRPSCHVAYGEAVAILAGDLLLNRAYELLIRTCRTLTGPSLLLAMDELAGAAGGLGMIGGQDLDLAMEKTTEDDVGLDEVLRMAERKTACLIRAAMVMGGYLAGTQPENIKWLARAGMAAGLAFQIRDDILDCLSNRDTLGKTPGKDRRAGKKTLVTVAGLDRAAALQETSTARALEAVRQLKAPQEGVKNLEQVIRQMTERNY